MTTKERYDSAKELYKEIGVDTDKAIESLKNYKISMHCWQGDDVMGFDNDGPLTGGIQTTGNYPGRARTPKELMADIDKVLSLVAGKHKINLHACYAIFEDDNRADRDAIKPEHFKKWVEFAKERGLGLDFNPTFFSHKMVKDNLTLSSPDEEVRKFWIRHGQACIKISEYFDRIALEAVVLEHCPDVHLSRFRVASGILRKGAYRFAGAHRVAQGEVLVVACHIKIIPSRQLSDVKRDDLVRLFRAAPRPAEHDKVHDTFSESDAAQRGEDRKHIPVCLKIPLRAKIDPQYCREKKK